MAELVARVGLIGHPVAHSRSPAMQQAAFDALGIAARYELWDTLAADLRARVGSLRAPEMLGANVTIPHKLGVAPLLDHLAPEVDKAAGAVNTIVRERTRGGNVRLVGHNTDLAGIAATLSELDAAPTGRHVLVLGGGGTARTVAAYAVSAGAASLTVAARSLDAAVALLAEITRQGWPLPQPTRIVEWTDGGGFAEELAECDLLVNATPMGMDDPDACPLPPAWLARMQPRGAVLDVVYAPHETALVRAACAAGLAATNGLPLLLHQGAAAFTLWTGQVAPLDMMRAALGLG